jgi:predicted amidohydrolase YtcJ
MFVPHSLTFLVIAALLAACSNEPAEVTPSVPPADLVLMNGEIATADPAFGTVEAVAVTGYQISAVGTDDEVARYIGPDTRVIELEGRMAMPGFIEGHGHYMSLGRSKQILDLATAKNWEEIVEMVAAAVEKAEPGDWIFGRGWHQDKWDSVPENAVEGLPRSTSTLSAASPNNPVRLTHASGHAYFVNDAALEAAGVDIRTRPTRRGGTIVRAPTGEATGMLRETAQRHCRRNVSGSTSSGSPPRTAKQIDRERARLAGEQALAFGVTSFQDAGERTRSFVDVIEFMKKLEDEGELPVRLYMMARGVPDEQLEEALPVLKMLPEGNDFLTVRGIKKQVDGALGAHGAWLLSPYTDLPGTDGLVLDTLEEIEANAEHRGAPRLPAQHPRDRRPRRERDTRSVRESLGAHGGRRQRTALAHRACPARTAR